MVMIVSPLIALMKDQASMFTGKGISAGYVSHKTRRRVIHGEFQLAVQLKNAI